ncbi:MAG: peptidoglycan DD-metalloendopeptidase family protein, partial [Patescibacteria group bacterium]|nr:peptidoglycan DD-metalloendopeptidase family protein [Patescibacteria group bacterium]
VDFATPNGTEIYSPLNGIIVRDTMGDKEYGNFICVWDPIQHCGVWFCHLQDVLVNPGEQVTAGQLVGHTNNTGNSTGPHVHVNFVETDPEGFRINLDNGEQGFLNLLDQNLVDILPFPGLTNNDLQTPFPTQPDTSVNTAPQSSPVVPTVQEQPVQTPTVPTPEQPTQPTQEVLDLQEQVKQLTEQNVQLTTKVQEVSDKYTLDLSNYQIMQAAGYSSVDDINKKVEQLQVDNTGLQKQLVQVNTSNAKLAEILKAKNEEDATAIDMGMKAQDMVKNLQGDLEAIAQAHNTKPTLSAILGQIAKIKNSYDFIVKQLQKKTIKQDIQTAGAVAQTIIPKKIQMQTALDFFAGLFTGNQKGVNK